MELVHDLGIIERKKSFVNFLDGPLSSLEEKLCHNQGSSSFELNSFVQIKAQVVLDGRLLSLRAQN